MIYICEVYKKKVIEAPTEEEALEKFMHLFDLGEEEVRKMRLEKPVIENLDMSVGDSVKMPSNPDQLNLEKYLEFSEEGIVSEKKD